MKCIKLANLYGFILIIFLWLLLLLPICRQLLYIVPCSVVSAYILFNMYPWLARHLHKRKLSYEDLELLYTNDPILKSKFQSVFTVTQQIGGSIAFGSLVAYAYTQYHSYTSIYQTLGILGGLISLYTRILGYIGAFGMHILYKLKRAEEYTIEKDNGFTCTSNYIDPDIQKPQETKQSNEINEHKK